MTSPSLHEGCHCGEHRACLLEGGGFRPEFDEESLARNLTEAVIGGLANMKAKRRDNEGGKKNRLVEAKGVRKGGARS